MMSCKRAFQLEVHHIDRKGTAAIENAWVLCQPCHSKTSGNGLEGSAPADFSVEVKRKALRRAGNQCQCPGCDKCL